MFRLHFVTIVKCFSFFFIQRAQERGVEQRIYSRPTPIDAKMHGKMFISPVSLVSVAIEII